MRVGIDITPLLRTRTGIAVCTKMLVESAVAAGHEVVGLVSGWRALRNGLPEELPRAARLWTPRPLAPLFSDLLRWPPVEAATGPLDIFVATNHYSHPSRRATNVALIHDVGRLVHPHLYRRRQVRRFRVQIRRCARFADLLVVPTEAVAREVVQLGLAERDRIRVVPWTARPLSPPVADRLWGVPDRPLIACVATMERHKNIGLLVRAFQRVASSVPHHLVIAGGGGSARDEVLAAARSNGASHRIHFLGHADEAQLSALYGRADVAVCPSLYEGFGLTLIEAMASGCPVLATDIPAHREVGGEAARFASGRDEREFASVLADLALDAGARARLREKGLERSRAFSGEETRRRLGELFSPRCGP